VQFSRGKVLHFFDKKILIRCQKCRDTF